VAETTSISVRLTPFPIKAARSFTAAPVFKAIAEQRRRTASDLRRREREDHANDDEADQEILPVWPGEEFCNLSFPKNEFDYTPESIDIDSFMESWIPNLIEDQITVGVFPNKQLGIYLISPTDLEHDLEKELDTFED